MTDNTEPKDPVIFDAKMLRHAVKNLSKAKEGGVRADLRDWLQSLLDRQTRPKSRRNSRLVVLDTLRECLTEAGVTEGRIAELGGPANSRPDLFPEFSYEWLSLMPFKKNNGVRLCNICEADHIPDASYDAVVSISVMEHVSEPFKAAYHIDRILKPGGISFHVAPFSYFYHGAPVDFWRFTPDGFKSLFPDYKPIRMEFRCPNRRRDNRGGKHNSVDRDGGAPFAVDAFGGWRENWMALYCGVKDPDWSVARSEKAVVQAVADLMSLRTQQGTAPGVAAQEISVGLRRMVVDTRGQLQRAAPGSGIDMSTDDILSIDARRVAGEIEHSFHRFTLNTRFDWLVAQPEG